MGYDYLRKNKIEEAIKIFRLNVDLFSESSNPYDSLGEGYLANGNDELAILNYKKSLELNPNNLNAKDILEMLRKKQMKKTKD